MTRFELATLALARRCSTTEPHPHINYIGADDRTWTYNLLITNQLLYQLSYISNIGSLKIQMATRMGFEPTTSAVTGRHSNQLNYRAINTPLRRWDKSPRSGVKMTSTCTKIFSKMMIYIVNQTLVEVTGLEPVTPCL